MATYFIAWFPMLLLAVLNGVFREAVLKKWMTDLAAHQVSTFTLILILAIYIRYIIHRFPPTSAAQAILIGGFWVMLTLFFEFGFGIYRGNSWSTMTADYNLLKGHLWVFVPISVLFAPLVFSLLQKR